jgi:hypothetical protein
MFVLTLDCATARSACKKFHDVRETSLILLSFVESDRGASSEASQVCDLKQEAPRGKINVKRCTELHSMHCDWIGPLERDFAEHI